jgi:thiamine kinase-like enzyme
VTTAAPADPYDTIRALPLWRRAVEIEPLPGGITNRNYLVRDQGRKAVVRLGGDIPIHGIMRFNEHAASRAAAAAGISPPVLHAGPGVLVIGHVEGKTLTAEVVRVLRDRCVALVRRAHREVPLHLRGPILSFNVFHILRDYGHALIEGGSRHAEALPGLMAVAEALEQAAGAIDLVFGHNDLLAGNFIDDGSRLWLIDWDYAGFNTPLFDLGGLSSNNGFGAEDDLAMLTAYFGAAPDDELRRRFAAMLAASLLRETMWSMVSEIHSTLAFDYAAYTAQNLARFEAAHAAFLAMES